MVGGGREEKRKDGGSVKKLNGDRGWRQASVFARETKEQ